MFGSSHRGGLVLVGLLAVLLALTLCTDSFAKGASVEYTSGIVIADRGDAFVLLDGGESVFPSNLGGMLKSGKVRPGERVDLKIVSDKGKHRGHVTVLK